MDLGLPDGIVQILPFNPAWNESFTAERERLKLAIGAQVVDIQHIGSTSIPSMPSKPVLDIGIAVVDFESAKDYIDPVVGLGYKYLGEYGILRRHFFMRGNPRPHHIHMLENNSREWRSHLLFKTFLSEHPDFAREYAQLKFNLAQKHKTDRDAYQNGKEKFIKRVLELAKEEQGY